MIDYERIGIEEQSSTDGIDEPRVESRRRSLRRRLVVAAIVVGLITAILRFAVLGDTLTDAITNPALLRSAMTTVADTPVVINAPGGPVIRGEPTGVQARSMSAIARAMGQPATAERWLIHGLAEPSSAYLSQFELCLLYWNIGQRPRAREACRQTTVSARYWVNQGYNFENLNQREEALAYYDIATAVDPDFVQGWHAMGRTLFALHRYEEAIAAYERMMVLDPTPPADVYESLGWSYLETNNLEMARDVLNRGLMVFPHQRTYYLAMADTFRAENDFRAADSWYTRMLQRWPGDVQAWSGRGDVAVASGRLKDAVQYYQVAVENQPQGFGYWLSLASSAWDEGDLTLANDAYQQALMLQPDNPSVLLQVGRFYAGTKRTAEARVVFEHVLQLQPDNREAATQLAAIVNSQQPPVER